tara:strand:- start:174 stop:344 length:171 start_codon:yes stop_codon:yes gene_type:complete
LAKKLTPQLLPLAEKIPVSLEQVDIDRTTRSGDALSKNTYCRRAYALKELTAKRPY